MAMTRTANATWSGDLPSGTGTVGVASGVFEGLPTSWRARTEAAEGKTSPEELLAAAHASCFSMAASNNLAKAGFPVERAEVTVSVTADRREQGWTVISSAITLRARVPERGRADLPRRREWGQGRLPDLARPGRQRRDHARRSA